MQPDGKHSDMSESAYHRVWSLASVDDLYPRNKYDEIILLTIFCSRWWSDLIMRDIQNYILVILKKRCEDQERGI
jgi:hypothetical protein